MENISESIGKPKEFWESLKYIRMLSKFLLQTLTLCYGI